MLYEVVFASPGISSIKYKQSEESERRYDAVDGRFSESPFFCSSDVCLHTQVTGGSVSCR